MAVTNAGHYGGDMPVLAIEAQAALRIIPRDRREAALNRRNGISLCSAVNGSRGAGCNIEADGLRMWGRGKDWSDDTRQKNASSRMRRLF